MDKFLDELTIEDLKAKRGNWPKQSGLMLLSVWYRLTTVQGDCIFRSLVESRPPSETAIFMKTTNTEVLMFPNLL